MRPDYQYPGRTYRFYNESVVYPFGFGLGYAMWPYSIEVSAINDLALEVVLRTLTLWMDQIPSSSFIQVQTRAIKGIQARYWLDLTRSL
jgi:hypothetical protein